ncbi:hypothetical protein XBP1_1340025 [Xenorhabdus bovienii str. puntauvense]|uniref:Uncharacterized protein n=2 Tax=Xenorhabdus bovienii TaxID=40576 RepID=A0A0B6X5D5_XENBV|nr:hypothetical protein XBP1_1340025 [Xenorhabdus bovienii str. puntauvense]CDM87933.1 protein of unknown function [Xenorhabdus bovienii]
MKLYGLPLRLLSLRRCFNPLGRSEGMVTNKIAAMSSPIDMERNNLISMALFSNK